MDENLKFVDFCDLDQFNEILTNWSMSTNMATIVIDSDGEYITGPIGFSNYCKYIRSSKKGLANCIVSDNTKKEYYTCHGGLYDFSAPICLPSGREIARILFGQVTDEFCQQPNFELIAEQYNLSRDQLQAYYLEIDHKRKSQLEASKSLLINVVENFVEKSYRAWLRKNENSSDKTLSQITKILYSFNITVDIKTFKYSLITGTGLERTVEAFKKFDKLHEAMPTIAKYIHPAYKNKPMELVRERILNVKNLKNGFVGSVEYPVLYPGEEKYEWQEINIFVSSDEDGKQVVNLLGRDVTQIHETQERNEKELKAAADRNQILSEITKMLYSYNLTLNLRTGKYSLIVGTGMSKFMDIFKSTDDYETAYNEKIKYLSADTIDQFTSLASLQALRTFKNVNGFVGSAQYGAIVSGVEEWHEVNVFVGTDDSGDPIANILGRDITDAHRRQEQKKNIQKAAIARDQLLSGVTKMLYSYNLSVNLNSWQYSLITGIGMKKAVEMMESTDDYVILSARLLKHIVPEDLSKIEELVGIESLQKVQNMTGYMGSITYEAVYDGEHQWHEMNLFMGTNENGEPIANILGRDITEAHMRQRKHELEIKAASAKDQILSEITKLMYSYNLTLNLNSGKYSLIIGTGMKKFVDIFLSTNDYETSYAEKMMYLVPEYKVPFDNIASLSSLRKHSKEQGFIGSLEYAANGDNGIEWHEINVFMGTNENGEKIANILGRDISEMHNRHEQHEKELKASMARDELLSGITKMLYSFNATINLNTWKYSLIVGTGMSTAMEIIKASDDYETTYNRLSTHLLPQYHDSLYELLSKPAILSQVGKSGYIDTIITAAQVGDNKYWQELNLFMGTNENGEPIANILGRDITEAQEKADTKAQLAIAQASNKAKSQFLSNMSHDIRTPINGIMGMLTIAKTHKNDPAIIDEALEKIEISSHHLLTLINDILDLNKLESGKMIFAKEPIDICKLAKEVFTIVEPMASDNISMKLDVLPSCIHRRVFGSPLHIREVLVNILSNAVKYNKPNGSVLFELDEINETNQIVTYQFKVIDTGIGMSEEFQKHMFETFNQENTQVKSKYQGSGLGLSIVKRIVDMMNGTISVQSVQGEGTEFVVTLSFEINYEPYLMETTDEKSISGGDIRGLNILLVEDNELNMEIAEFMLEEAGGKITKAVDGQQAVEVFSVSEPGRFDVILMDIQMPNMDGMTATRMIRQMKRPDAKIIPIFALTANAFAEDVQNCKAAGMNGHFAKPLDMSKVISTIAQYRK